MRPSSTRRTAARVAATVRLAAKELVPEIGESHAHTSRRQRVQSVLELLDVGVGRIERVEERIRDLVDEPLNEPAHRRTLLRGRVER